MPIVIGKKPAKMVAIAIAILTMFCLGYIQRLFLKTEDYLSFYYFTFVLQFSFIFLIFKIFRATTKKEYRFAGNTAKFIMLLGIVYLFLFEYILLYLKDAT